jgi:cyclohexanone monooxygenase
VSSSDLVDDGDNERRAGYESRWTRGGLTFMSVYNNLALDKAANDTAANFVREKIAEIVSVLPTHSSRSRMPDPTHG